MCKNISLKAQYSISKGGGSFFFKVDAFTEVHSNLYTCVYRNSAPRNANGMAAAAFAASNGIGNYNEERVDYPMKTSESVAKRNPEREVLQMMRKLQRNHKISNLRSKMLDTIFHRYF